MQGKLHEAKSPRKFRNPNPKGMPEKSRGRGLVAQLLRRTVAITIRIAGISFIYGRLQQYTRDDDDLPIGSRKRRRHLSTPASVPSRKQCSNPVRSSEKQSSPRPPHIHGLQS